MYTYTSKEHAVRERMNEIIEEAVHEERERAMAMAALSETMIRQMASQLMLKNGEEMEKLNNAWAEKRAEQNVRYKEKVDLIKERDDEIKQLKEEIKHKDALIKQLKKIIMHATGPGLFALWFKENIEETDELTPLDELNEDWDNYCDEIGISSKQRLEKKDFKSELCKQQEKTEYGIALGPNAKEPGINGTNRKPLFNFKVIEVEDE